MKIVEQSVNIWGECPTDTYEAKLWIERAGRTCYNSPMPTVPNPDKFLDRVMANDPPHSSMFEHSNLVLGVTNEFMLHRFASRWLTIDESGDNMVLYGNLRAFMEVLDLKSIDRVKEYCTNSGLYSIPVEKHTREQKRVTVELHTDRNVLAEITRHRDDVAFSVRSQRYVDEQAHMEFIKPSWYTQGGFIIQETFLHSCKEAELNYRTLRKSLPPQHSRVALTGQVKTVIVMTAYLPEWDWIFTLRRAPGAYPQMIALMDMVHAQFVELGYAGPN